MEVEKPPTFPLEGSNRTNYLLVVGVLVVTLAFFLAAFFLAPVFLAAAFLATFFFATSLGSLLDGLLRSFLLGHFDSSDIGMLGCQTRTD